MSAEIPMQGATSFSPVGILRPSAFQHSVTDLHVQETNLSWIVLTGPYAYKIKKGVAFSFVDQSTPEQRKTLCEAELRLNRRLASDLYEAVVPISTDGEGLHFGGSGVVADYAVKMKQFASDQELSVLLEQRTVDAVEIGELGVRLADFHQSLPGESAAHHWQGTQQLHDAVLGTLATVLCHVDADSRAPELGSLVDWIHDFLHNHLDLLRRREREGHIRECHGDLHARNIVRWHRQLVPFDSLEFDPKLRWIDTMNDAAFLFMDLIAHDRPDLAFVFLNAYVSRTGDYDGVRLLHFYAVYRALVRALVDSLAAQNRPAACDRFRRYARLRINTATQLSQASASGLIMMHGLSGSGKSAVSMQLAEQLGAVQIRSDVERKRLQTQSGATSIHTEEFDQRTYAHLLECAESCLQGGVTTIVDAAFLQAVDRDRFRALADAHGIPLLIVSCQAPLAELEARIERRRRAGRDPSDADVPELHRQMETWVPIGTDERSHLITVDTMLKDAVPEAVSRIRALLLPGMRTPTMQRMP